MMRVNKKPLVILAGTIAAFFSLWMASKFFLINISQSMPLGLYQIDKQRDPSLHTLVFERGDIVAVCLDEKNRDIGLERTYLLAGNKCQKSEPLIKTIFATPGDNIILKMNGIVLNGKVYQYPTVSLDSRGRPLKIFPRGKYLGTPGYWLIGTNDKKSWDSRYWGPVVKSQILYRLSPLLTFK